MTEQNEMIWRENGNIHVRSRFGSRNYTMLAALVALLAIPTGLPLFGMFLGVLDIGFIGEDLSTIFTSIGLAIISLMPALLVSRLILFKFNHLRETEITLDADYMIAGSFKRKWTKTKEFYVAPATRVNFRLAPILAVVTALDKLTIGLAAHWLPKPIGYSLDQPSYGVWQSGRIVGGVFYDADVAVQLMEVLTAEAERRQEMLIIEQTEFAL